MLAPIIKNLIKPDNTPLYCTYTVTWRCNAGCTMCTNWKKKSSEMSVADVERVFKKIPSLTAVRLTGGEPFVRPDLVDIVDAIIRGTRVEVVMITTNGILTDRVVNFIKTSRAKNIRLKISLNGYEESDDKVMNVRGAFTSTMNTIKELKALQGTYKFYFGINHTIFNMASYRDSQKIRSLCKELKLSYLPVVAYGRVPLYSERDNEKVMDPASENHFDFKPEEVRMIVEELKQAAGEIESPMERMFKMFYLKGIDPAQRPKNVNCRVLRNHIRILPDGNVPVCLYNHTAVGNLLEEEFEQVWKGPRIEKQRQWVDKCSGCWVQCDIFPNQIYSRNLIPFVGEAIFGGSKP